MFGSKKISTNEVRQHPPGASATDVHERRHATLLRNELVAGNVEIADRIIELAQPATFSKKHKLIEQGASDDSVYFIMSGSVDVRISRRHIDFRNAPDTVGEMAAKKAGAARTADVIVKSKQIDVLVLSATEFRKIMQDFPTFSKNLDDLIDGLSRRKINQLGEKSFGKALPWTTLSAIAAVVAGVIGALATWAMGFDALYIFWSSLPLALIFFIFMVQLNPDFRYRYIAGMAATSLVVSVAYSSLSFMLTVDGQNLGLPLVDFSVGAEQKLAVFGVGSVALLLLTVVAGYLDIKLTASRDDQ